jgi:heme-degrading monooxygenase HmoA
MPQYVTIGTLKIGPGQRPFAEGIADHGVHGFAQMPGFVSVTFFLDEAANEYGAYSVWESREQAEAADQQLTPQFEQAFGDQLQGKISTHIYEIYVPNSK